MAKYRTFRRTWWADKACTIPKPGRKEYMSFENTEEDAQAFCRWWNEKAFGPSMRGPRGACYEYEAI